MSHLIMSIHNFLVMMKNGQVLLERNNKTKSVDSRSNGQVPYALRAGLDMSEQPFIQYVEN